MFLFQLLKLQVHKLQVHKLLLLQVRVGKFSENTVGSTSRTVLVEMSVQVANLVVVSIMMVKNSYHMSLSLDPYCVFDVIAL